jgi:hypothetical protein
MSLKENLHLVWYIWKFVYYGNLGNESEGKYARKRALRYG